jgi:hypothetical protein
VYFLNNKYRFLVFIVILFVCFLFTNPLRWPASCLRLYLLQMTPLNSKYDEVEKKISFKNWDVNGSSKKFGFYDQRDTHAKITGDMYIRASLGDYWGIPFKANVTVYWGFSKQGELIDVWVWKTWDGF